MNGHFLLQANAIVLIATLLLYIPIWVIALNKKRLIAFDFVFPFIPVLLWLILTMVGIGSRDPANLIEIPIILFLTLAAHLHMIFSPYSLLRTKRGTTIILSILLVVTLLLRVFMPVYSD